jgi:hypothetical protein
MEPDEQVQGPPDVNTGDFEAVLAAAERGEYDNQPAAADQGDTQGAPSEVAAEPQGAPEPEAASTPQATPEVQPAQESPEDWQRKYHSVAGNLAQVARERQQLAAQAAEYQRQMQAQQAEFQRQLQQREHEAQLRGSLPADEADAAIQEYRAAQQRQQQEAEFRQGADAYQQYLAQQHQQIEAAKVELFRQSLPSVMPDFARHMAAQFGAPEGPLLEMVQTEPMQRAIAMVATKRDMDLIAEVLAAKAQVEATKDAARKAENAKQAVASGAFRSEPETARGSGLPEIERIKAMDDTQFDKMVADLVARSGG